MFFNLTSLMFALETVILFVGCLILCLNQKKRNNYVFRIIAAFVMVFVASYTVYALTQLIEAKYIFELISLHSLLALVMFGVIFGAILICYKTKVKLAIVKTITIEIASILSNSLGCFIASLTFGLNNFPEYFYAIMLLLPIIFITLTILVFWRRLKTYDEKNYHLKNVIILSVLLIAEIFLEQFIEIGCVYGDSVPMLAVLCAANIFSCLLILYIMLKNICDEKQSLKDQLIFSLLTQEAKQFALDKQNMKNIVMKNQALNNKYYFLDGSVPKATIHELEELSLIYDQSIATGNEALDLVLKEKSFLAENNKIEFLGLANGRCLSFIKDNDLYSLMTNLLSKAIDECASLKDDNKKSISLNIRDTSLYESIHLEYYFNDMVQDEHGVLVKRTNLAGDDINQQAINYLVKKYNGIISYTSENDILIVDIAFCKNII